MFTCFEMLDVEYRTEMKHVSSVRMGAILQQKQTKKQPFFVANHIPTVVTCSSLLNETMFTPLLLYLYLRALSCFLCALTQDCAQTIDENYTDNTQLTHTN